MCVKKIPTIKKEFYGLFFFRFQLMNSRRLLKVRTKKMIFEPEKNLSQRKCSFSH